MKKITLFGLTFFAMLSLSIIAKAQYFTENFENGGTFPAGWTITSSNLSDYWAIDQGDLYGPGTAHGGTYCAYFDDYNFSSGVSSEMITPAIDLSSATSPQLTFWYYDGGGSDFVDILVSTDGTNYTSIYNTLTTVNPWTEITVDLTSYAGNSTVYISFKGTSEWGYTNPHVDDIIVAEPPTCFPPTNLAVSNITTSTADFSWVAPVSGTPAGYLWEIVVAGTGSNGTIINAGTTTTPTVNANTTGLTLATSYDLYVKTDCGSGDGLSTWAGPYTFTTSCDVYTTPFTEGFESATAPPTCWSMFYENPTPAPGNLMIHATDQAFTGTKSFRFSSYDYGSPYNQYLISPEINFTQDMLLTFEYRASDPYPETFSVGTSTTGNNYSTDFTWGSDITDASDTGWTKYSAIIPAGTKYIAIQYKSDYEYYLYVDEFKLKIPSTENSILTFDIPSQISSTVGNGTVDILMPCSTDVTALIPAITVSAGATISPASGVPQDFTTPVSYIVTAENGTTSTWTVTVNVSASPMVDLGPDTIQCGGTVTLDAGNTGATYLWSDNSTAQTLTVSTSGTYSVTVNNGCTATDAIDITIKTPVTVDLGADVTQCGGSVTLDASNTGATYLWTGGSAAQTLTVSTSGTYSVTVTNTNGCTDTDTIDVTINTLPTITLSSPNAATICQGDSVAIVLNLTGTAPWTWVGDDGSGQGTFNVNSSPYTTYVSPMVNTTYSILSVTDANGCTNTSTDAVVVTVNTAPIVNLGTDIIQCGGSVTLDASNTGATYLWTGGSAAQTLTVSTSGTYSVTVTNTNGCTDTDTIDVTINALPTVDLGTDITQCGGSVTLDAGNAGATYLWSDNSTAQTLVVSTSDTYSVTVTNSCGTGTDAINITINALPTVSAGADQSVCAGTAITLSGSGATSYTWDNGVTNGTPFTPLTTTTYTVIGTDANGCSNTDQVIVTVYPLPGPVTITGNAGVLTSDAVSGNQWYEQVSGIIAGETNQSYTPTQDGYYYVIVTDVNGCTAMSNIIFFTSVNNINNSSSILIYPNPTSDYFTLDIHSNNLLTNVNVEVYNYLGQRVITKSFNPNKNSIYEPISLNELATGNYFVKVFVNAQQWTGSIIKK